MIFHDVEQNSEEWFGLRIGKVTTSNFGKFMANYGKAFGEPAKRYAFKIAKEQVTGEKSEEDSFTSKHIEEGHEFEPIARREYELKTFEILEN